MEYKLIMRRFFTLMNDHHAFIAQSVEKEGGIFYGQLHLLEMIKNHPECTQKEIAMEFGISPASVTKTLKVFEKKGLVERVQSEKDCRCLQLKITQKGEDAICIQKNIFSKADCTTFEGISDEELETMYNLFGKMIANLERKDINGN